MSKNHKLNVEVQAIVCADFFTTFSECCDLLDTTNCQNRCNAKLIFLMGAVQFEHSITLLHNIENTKMSESFDFSEKSFQIPTAMHIILVDNVTEFVIERWVLVYQLINSRQISLFQRGVHWKCKLNISFE
ncbi:hypothetical protein MXB_206 [Myxobolus squamalis]|nr:hypothetical protein MXB_206 [Myxobolus squamalis]